MSRKYSENVLKVSGNWKDPENPEQWQIPDKMSVRKLSGNAHVLEHFPDTHFVRNLYIIISGHFLDIFRHFFFIGLVTLKIVNLFLNLANLDCYRYLEYRIRKFIVTNCLYRHNYHQKNGSTKLYEKQKLK